MAEGEQWRFLSIQQIDENDPAQMVILHEPSLPNWMGSIHPNGSLYERPVDVGAARKEFENFRHELEKNGCTVFSVKDILLMECETNIVARVALEDFAFASVTYVLDPSGDVLTETDHFYLSDLYKRQCIDKMNNEQLVDLILTSPKITLKKADRDTELLAVGYEFHPLVNLVYCRDQQITTCKGIVMASPSSPIRAPEVRVMKFCFNKLGLKIVGEIPTPGRLEGGDFYPAGRDLCFIGVGHRSNMYAINHMLQNDLFGTRRVAVVKDYFDQDQQRMHLDTVCNIIGNKTMLLLETIIGTESPLRRLVDEYVQDEAGKYILSKHDVEFSLYLRQEGWSVIPVTEEHQAQYGCNGLNLGNGKIISVDKSTAKHLARSDKFHGKIINIDFSNMTTMYGSVHCCSQVVARKSHDHKVDTNTTIRLCTAVSDGILEQVKLLVKEGADLDAPDYDRRTPLHIAAAEGHVDVLRFLLAEGANPNKLDRFRGTPLQDAIRGKHDKAAEIIRAAGGKTGPELIQPLPSMATLNPGAVRLFPRSKTKTQSGHRMLMVAPCNFCENKHTEDTNLFMGEAAQTEDSLAHVKGRRAVRQLMLRQYANLHKILCSIGADVYLYTHETYQDIPEAVFCADWFSTHSAAETGGEPTFVLYPMFAPNRRGERTGHIIEFLRNHYSRCIDLTACEEGIVEVRSGYKAAEPYAAVEVVSSKQNGKFLEFSSLVLDRENKIAYASISPRCDLEVAKLWAVALGYTLVTCQSQINGRIIHHTSAILQIGTGYASICREAIPDEKEQKAVIDQLNLTGHEIVELSLQQAMQMAALSCEISLPETKERFLIASESMYKAFTPDQLTIYAKHVKILHVDLHILEKIGGGSVRGVVSPLF
eukprot:TRINITY_DN1297_c0_g1_i1.p1 TRINITY_DN1297_c0_g1~~TRINITY_DN1297_c0_g1_i1.p1  ORF type:complete len:907 (-),score=155.10 TRINITY_DN1297_c0_g1_i1:52-2682(-)